MEGWGAVQEHRVALDDVAQDVPHLGTLALDEALRALHRLHEPLVLELPDDERLEQLQRHVLRQPALVQLQLGADHDDRAARIVDALAEEILAEAALLPLEHVGEGLERAVSLPAHGAAPAPVVEEGVHRLLQHALLVPEDDFRRPDVDELLQPVVPVDDAPVKIVQIRGREPAALQRHQRTQIRRQHRDHVQDHPLGAVSALAERLDDPEPLQRLLLPLHRVLDLRDRAELRGQLVQVDLLQEVADRLGAHLGRQRDRLVLGQLVVFVLGNQLLLLQAAGPWLDDHVRLVEVADRHVEQVSDAAGHGLEEPDVRDRDGQVDVTQPLAPHLGLRHLDAAAVADDPAVADALVLAAVALPVLHGTEDLFTEQPVALRLERPVVDGLRLGHFAVGPPADRLRRRQHDADRVERDPSPHQVAVVRPRQRETLALGRERGLDSEQFLHGRLPPRLKARPGAARPSKGSGALLQAR